MHCNKELGHLSQFKLDLDKFLDIVHVLFIRIVNIFLRVTF